MSLEIGQRVRQLKSEIAAAAQRSGRSPEEIKILAATKTRNVAEIMTAANAGITIIGENTLQEAMQKFEFLPLQIKKHMIGTLQPNKVKAAVRIFDCIQSVTSLELATMIDTEARKVNKKFPVLIEANPSGEASKQGMPLEAIKVLAEQISELKNIELRGLMAMLPHAENPDSLRPIFRIVSQLFEELKTHFGKTFDTLSMGMSNDYIVAVEEGATMVRLGTTIFGLRDY